MANKRPTEASWDSDDELLGDDMAGISAFPVEKDEDLDEDALLGASDDETDMGVTHADILDTSHEPGIAFEQGQQIEGEEHPDDHADYHHNDELGGEEEGIIDLGVDEFEEFFDEGQEEELIDRSGAVQENPQSHDNSQVQAEDEGETTGMEESFADTTQDTEGGGAGGSDSESEESEDEDSRRGRFISERSTAATVTKTQRPITDIPDTLEVSQEDQAKIEKFLQKKPNSKRMGRGGNHQQANTRFQRPMGRGGPRQRNMNMQRFPPPRPRAFMGNQRPRQITPQQARQISPQQPRQISPQQPRKILINPHFRGSMAVPPTAPWGAGTRMPGSAQNFQPRGVMFGQQVQNQQVLAHNAQGGFQARPDTMMHQQRPILQQPPMQAWGAQQQQHQQNLHQQQLQQQQLQQQHQQQLHHQQQHQQQQQQGGFMQQRTPPVRQPQGIVQQRGVRPMFEGMNRMPTSEHQMQQRAPQNMNMGPRQSHPPINKPRLNVPASQQYQTVNRSISSASPARPQQSSGPRFQDSRIVSHNQTDFHGKPQNPSPRFPNSQQFSPKQKSTPAFRAPRPVHTEPTHPVVKRHLTPIPQHEPHDAANQNQPPQTPHPVREVEEVQKIQSLVSPTPTVPRVKPSPSQDMDRLLARKQRFGRSPKLATPTKTSLKRLSSQSSSDADPSPVRAAKMVKTTASTTISAAADDDTDLRKKLEEQKRLRQRIIEQKELRRQQMANKKRAELQGKQAGAVETSQTPTPDDLTQQQSIAVHTGPSGQAAAGQGGGPPGAPKAGPAQRKRKVVSKRVTESEFNAMLEAQNPGGKVFPAQTTRPAKSPVRPLLSSQRGGPRLNNPGQTRLNNAQGLNMKSANQTRFQARGRGQVRGRGTVARGRGQIGRGMSGRGNVRPNQNIQPAPGPNRPGNVDQHFTNQQQHGVRGQGMAQNMPGAFRQNSAPAGQQMTPNQFRMTSPRMQGNAGRKVISGNRNGHLGRGISNNRQIIANRPEADWSFNPEDRKVIMGGGGDHPMNPAGVGVRIDGIPANTSQKKVFDLAQQVGPVDGVHLITAERRAMITFRYGEHANVFARRFNRHMLDLSMITVSVLQS